MTDAKLTQPKRGKEILWLIKESGPLTIDLLFRMLTPSMAKQNIRKALQVLRDKNLIEVVQSTTQITFYMIAQGPASRMKSADILKCHPDEIKQPLLRKQDWFHNQWCEYWILNMKRYFPDSKIVREGEINSDQIAMNVLGLKNQDFDLRPDFLLMIPKTETTEAVHLAFEIERTRKSEQRLIRKFKKYMGETGIDGLIYICDSGRLSETIRLLYQTKLVDRSQRQKRFGENFFVFSDSLDGGGPMLSRLFNACGKPTTFEKWCGYLTSTSWTKRRDEELI
jgi:hypothetical protein